MGRRHRARFGPDRVGHGDQRTESGYALLATLAMMAVFSVTIIALLGMTFTSMAATSAAATRANQLRAADGALEIAVNQVRMDPDAALGAATGCHLGTPEVSFDQGTAATSDDVAVALECCPNLDVACTSAAPVPPKVAAIANTNRVALIGDAYDGDLWGSDRWRTDCGPAPGPGCLPWGFALGNVNYYTSAHEITDATHASLIYSGPTPLQFVGDVDVRHTAVALRNPTGAGPAIQVGGDYRQGDPGLFATSSGGPCGELSATFAWTRAGGIDDLHDGPSCADPSVGGLDGSAALRRPPTPPAEPQTVPTTCPSTAVVTFAPGTYDATQTAALNRLFSGECHKTYLFTSGDYWFDVNDRSRSIEDRNALVIDDAASAFVFGAPDGWDPAVGATDADFPDACHHDAADVDPSHDGVSVTLSSRTTIRHLSGRLAMCGHRPNGAAVPIIWQDPAPADGWVARPTAASSTDFSSPELLLSGPDQGHSGASKNCTRVSPCFASKSVTFTGWGGTVDPGPSRLRSAIVLVSGYSTQGNGPGASTRIDVYERHPDGTYGSAALCSSTFSKLPDRWITVAFDLLAGSGNCASSLHDRSQLFGAKIVMTLNLANDRNGTGYCRLFSCAMSESLDFVSLQTNAWTAKATSDHVSSAGWLYADRIADSDGLSATAQLTCNSIICAQPRERTITLTDFGDASPTDPLVPAGPMSSVGVTVKGSADTSLIGSPKTTVKLTLADGSMCAARFSYMAFDQQRTYFDLLEPLASTPDATVAATHCPDLLRGRTAAALEGASVVLKLFNSCFGYTLSTDPVCLNYAVPSIDSVYLSAASAGYTRPSAPLRVTINSDGASDGDARFNVFGPVSVPHNDVDVRWAGPAEDSVASAEVPVVGGSLVANGIGSDVDATNPAAAAGLLCCSPAKPSGRTVRINARIDGVVRGTALIEIGDTSGGAFHAGTQLTVVDWRTCGSEACT